jgi:hypothetical protein
LSGARQRRRPLVNGAGAGARTLTPHEEAADFKGAPARPRAFAGVLFGA